MLNVPITVIHQMLVPVPVPQASWSPADLPHLSPIHNLDEKTSPKLVAQLITSHQEGLEGNFTLDIHFDVGEGKRLHLPSQTVAYLHDLEDGRLSSVDVYPLVGGQYYKVRLNHEMLQEGHTYSLVVRQGNCYA